MSSRRAPCDASHSQQRSESARPSCSARRPAMTSVLTRAAGCAEKLPHGSAPGLADVLVGHDEHTCSPRTRLLRPCSRSDVKQPWPPDDGRRPRRGDQLEPPGAPATPLPVARTILAISPANSSTLRSPTGSDPVGGALVGRASPSEKRGEGVAVLRQRSDLRYALAPMPGPRPHRGRRPRPCSSSMPAASAL